MGSCSSYRMTVPYYGGKFRHLDFVLNCIPPSLDGHFVDLFGGSGVVLMNRAPSILETYNDISERMVRFFRVARDHPDELSRVLALTPFSRREQQLANDPCDDELESARRLVVRLVMSVNGQLRSAGWKHSVDVSGSSVGMASGCAAMILAAERVKFVAERFRRVQLECLPAVEVVQKYDRPETIFYCDPPYVSATRTKTNTYADEMTDDDHRELASSLRRVKGKVVVSGYDCDLYRDLYRGWRVERDRVKATSASRSRHPRREVCWMNFDSPSPGLF